jgi:hypothetical protein
MNNLFINNLQWSESNLSLTKFQNGDDISFADNPYKWTKLNYRKQPAYSINPFMDSDLIPRLGLIYNIYALIDKRGLIPVGQKLPNFSEWESLNNYFLCCIHPDDSESVETEAILDDLESVEMEAIPYDSESVETEAILDDLESVETEAIPYYSETEKTETILGTLFQSVIFDNNNIKIEFTDKNFFNWFAGGKVSPSGLISEFGESAYFWADEFCKNSYGGFVKFSKAQNFKTELNYFHRQDGFYIRTIQE